MNTIQKPIALGDMDWENQTFAVRSFSPCDRLDASLRRCGFLQPPWVWAKTGKNHVIVDGFKRLLWAGRNGIGKLDCIVFPKESDPTELLLRRIEGKLFGPDLNTAEKAQIISRLTECIPKEQIFSRYFPHLNVSSKPEVLEKWCRLATADDALLEAAASGEVSERAALELATWKDEARVEALSLLTALRCSASIQTEILERISEVAKRDGKERLEIFADPELLGILRDPGTNHRQKTQTVRNILTRRRFPRLRAREERFAREIAAANLPGNMRVLPPPAFEGEEWQLAIAFFGPQELLELLERARSLAHSPELSALMAPYRIEENGP